MKHISALFITIFFCMNFTHAQNTIRISAEDGSSGFEQTDPRLYYATDSTIYVAWEDYRYGSTSYFTRKYDNTLNPLCDNFQILSNQNLVENNDNLLFCIRERNFSDPLGGGFATSYGAIYKDFIPVNTDFPFYGYQYGWCGTGFTGREDHLLPAQNGFLFFGRYDYDISIVRLSESGDILRTKTGLYESDEYKVIVSTDIARLKDSLHIVGWFEFTNYDSLTGPWYGFLDDNDELMNKVNLGQLLKHSFPYFDFEGIRLLKIQVLSDSRTIIWLFNRFNKTLYSYYFENFYELPLVDSLAIQSNGDYYDITDIHFTNVSNNHFFVFFKERLYPDYNYHYQGYQFNDKAEYSGLSIVDSSKTEIINENISYLGNDQFITTAQADDDIYLYTMSGLQKKDSTRVNTDLPYSNERYSKITAYDEQTFFVSWQSGKNAFGRKVSKEGKTDIDVISLAGSRTLFNKNIFVNYWDSGIQFMDADFNIVKTDTLVPAIYGNYLTAEILSDSVVMVAYVDSNRIGLRKYDAAGHQLDEKIITKDRKIYFKPELFVNDDNTFWLCDDYRSLVLFNTNLSILKETASLTFHPDVKLSEKTFFGYTSYFDEILGISHYTGYLFNDSNDTLQVYNEMPPPSSDFTSLKINDKSFLLLWYKGNKITGKVYYADGNSQPEKTFYQAPEGVSSVDAAFARLSDKALFSWSDNQVKQQGYSVNGRIYDLHTITSVEEKHINTPEHVYLGSAYPNPFNPSTRISYQLSQPGQVTLTIYNTLGQQIKTLINNNQQAGNYTITFDAKDLSSGLYFYRLEVTGGEKRFADTKKMLLVR